MSLRRWTCWTCGVIGLVLLAGPISASPATGPASKNGSEPVAVVQSPKEALKAYNDTAAAGDADKLIAMQQANNDAERRVAQLMAATDIAVAKLERAASEKFGHAAKEKVAKAIHDATNADIDAADQTIEGDKARIKFKDSDSPTIMVKVEGTWKPDVSAAVEASGGDADAICDYLVKRTQTAEHAMQELTAGHYPDVDALVSAIKEKVGD